MADYSNSLDSRVSRELGNLENFYTTLHDLGFQYNLAIVARYSCDTALLSQELVFLALREAIRQHAALSLVVSPVGDNGNGGPCFRLLREIDLDEVVEFINKPPASSEEEERKYLDGVLSQQNSRGFNMDGSLPLWRIVVLQGEGSLTTDLIFVWHHVIADEHSGLVFHSTLLGALRSASNKTEDEDEKLAIVPTPNLPITLPLENYLYPKSPTSKLFNKLKFPLPTGRGRWTGSPHHGRKLIKTPIQRKSISVATTSKLESYFQSEQASIKTLIRRISIPVASISRLESRCQSEQISITAFLRVLVGKALAETFEQDSQLRCETVVSLRPSFSSRSGINNEMSLLMTASRQYYTNRALLGSEGKFPWGVAKKRVPKIEKEKIIEFRDATLESLRDIPDIRSHLLQKIDKKRENSYSIVNIGVFDGGAAVSPSATASGGNHQWSISKMTFSQSCNVIGSAVQFCIVSTKGGEMDIVLSWQDGVVLEDDIDRVVRTLREQLLVLADGG
ncbi:MAG: hypothetical protein M1840_005228 [Geoglossum simile]|nr:MAG: hypothetical protein M1840_005228 [Geoglossum simile]